VSKSLGEGLSVYLGSILGLSLALLSFGGNQAFGEAPVKQTVSQTDDVTIIRSVTYHLHEDGKRLLADIYLPAKRSKPYPTILMIHGGAWFSGNKVHVALHAHHAATEGYAVVAINYRLAPRYKFPAQLEDLNHALNWIDAKSDEYGFDPNNVAGYGYSAGAHLICLLGTTQMESKGTNKPSNSTELPPHTHAREVRALELQARDGVDETSDTTSKQPTRELNVVVIEDETNAEPPTEIPLSVDLSVGLPVGPYGESSVEQAARPSIKLKAIVAGGTPSEFSWIPRESQRLAFWLGGSPKQVPKTFAQASPTTHVDKHDPPVFMFHGETDRIVPISSPRQLLDRLTENGVEASLHVVPGADHMQGFLDGESRTKAIEFLDNHLKAAGKQP